jgi:hypothetical protein
MEVAINCIHAQQYELLPKLCEVLNFREYVNCYEKLNKYAQKNQYEILNYMILGADISFNPLLNALLLNHHFALRVIRLYDLYIYDTHQIMYNFVVYGYDLNLLRNIEYRIRRLDFRKNKLFNLACRYRNIADLQILLDLGFNCRLCSNDGVGCLYHAVLQRNHELCDFLLANGCELSQHEYKLLSHCNHDILEFLVDIGCESDLIFKMIDVKHDWHPLCIDYEKYLYRGLNAVSYAHLQDKPKIAHSLCANNDQLHIIAHNCECHGTLCSTLKPKVRDYCAIAFKPQNYQFYCNKREIITVLLCCRTLAKKIPKPVIYMFL